MIQSGAGDQRVNVSIRILAAGQDRAVWLERERRAACGFHLRRLEDGPSTGMFVFFLIPEQLSQFRGDPLAVRVRAQRLLVKCLSLIELWPRQSNLPVGGKSPRELGVQLCRVRIPGRGPRPVGRGGIPVFSARRREPASESSKASAVFSVIPLLYMVIARSQS